MKRYLLVILAVAVLFSISCKPSKNNPAPSGSGSYLPVTSGSNWSYKDDVSTSTGNVAITMTGATAIFNGKTYYATKSVSDKAGASTGYFYADDHSYARRGAYAQDGIVIELQMADDSKAVGYTWTTQPTDDGFVEGIAVSTINTIKEKNITKTVNGKSFTNVIHTQVDLQYDSESNAVYDMYLAKGVGLIELDTHAYGILISSQTITGYTIK